MTGHARILRDHNGQFDLTGFVLSLTMFLAANVCITSPEINTLPENGVNVVIFIGLAMSYVFGDYVMGYARGDGENIIKPIRCDAP